VQDVFAANAAETMHMSPAELRKALERDAKEWAAVVKATGVKVN
jgi:tripartite-type tricarboxylate transporter receptor subunit TctC